MKSAFLLIPTLLLIACGGSTQQTDNTTKHAPDTETPKALKDDGGSVGDVMSYSRSKSGSLVDKLYEELIDKNPELQKIEDALEDLQGKVNDKKNDFAKYDGKSEDYYGAAGRYSDRITDSTLKKQIHDLIAKSENSYKSKTAGVSGLINQLDKGTASLNDHHTVLKIVATLPQIEQYQKDNLPQNKTYYGLIKEQQKLQADIVKNTPKN